VLAPSTPPFYITYTRNANFCKFTTFLAPMKCSYDLTNPPPPQPTTHPPNSIQLSPLMWIRHLNHLPHEPRDPRDFILLPWATVAWSLPDPPTPIPTPLFILNPLGVSKRRCFPILLMGWFTPHPGPPGFPIIGPGVLAIVSAFLTGLLQFFFLAKRFPFFPLVFSATAKSQTPAPGPNVLQAFSSCAYSLGQVGVRGCFVSTLSIVLTKVGLPVFCTRWRFLFTFSRREFQGSHEPFLFCPTAACQPDHCGALRSLCLPVLFFCWIVLMRRISAFVLIILFVWRNFRPHARFFRPL